MTRGWKTEGLGEVLEVLRNGINCTQDKMGQGDKITRIETISQAMFDINKVGYCKLSESDKIKYKIEHGDILFSHINSPPHVGKTAFFDSSEEIYHGVNLLLMRPKKLLSSSYLEYYLKFLHLSGYWKKVCKQSVNQASVNQQDINKVIITFPESLPEQQRIVAILDETFEAIAKAKRNAAKNLQNTRDLFESYLESVFANPGDGWEEKKLGDVCTLQRGFDLPKQSRKSGEYPLVSSSGISDMHNIWKVKAPGVVTGRSGSIGSVFFIEDDFWPLNTVLYVKDFHGNYPKFIYFLLKQFNLGKYSTGVGVPTLNRNFVHDEIISIPVSILDQQSIASKLDALSAETKKLETIYQKKLDDLDELKKSFLQKAFEGELTH